MFKHWSLAVWIQAAAAICFAVAAISGCTDTDRASLGAYGTPSTVQCYSGGKLFYDGKSTGRVQNAAHSDGYEFKDAATGKLVRINGHCLVQN